ncbi:MAG: 1-(5-phosphoribosyl)-5-[(5-phosphoribosylamino)methylideneamino]imidazole-4-carboxamide isomerase [Fibrobacteres bacterium]|nr:1-(5-phosphoribosyl)-5-[(5-phosphoribosylamino)methylideneamino]imidazole-4-carboxamide isomerase [Fibrobacterota bacterium]
MFFIPAIDLMGGKCVRLIKGEKNARTDYSDDPAGTALEFEKAGAKWIHVVDLDGAFEGVRKNSSTIMRIVNSVKVPIEVGGGVRTIEDVRTLLELGVSRVIIGTAAVNNPTLVETAVRRFGRERIAVGIDARDGMVAVKGWIEETEMTAVDLGKRMKSLGVVTVIYTDINRDGMLGGPNIQETLRFANKTGLSVIVSGGVHSIDDIKAVAAEKSPLVVGCISGKAIYEGKFSVAEGVTAAEGGAAG